MYCHDDTYMVNGNKHIYWQHWHGYPSLLTVITRILTSINWLLTGTVEQTRCHSLIVTAKPEMCYDSVWCMNNAETDVMWGIVDLSDDSLRVWLQRTRNDDEADKREVSLNILTTQLAHLNSHQCTGSNTPELIFPVLNAGKHIERENRDKQNKTNAVAPLTTWPNLQRMLSC